MFKCHSISVYGFFCVEYIYGVDARCFIFSTEEYCRGEILRKLLTVLMAEEREGERRR